MISIIVPVYNVGSCLEEWGKRMQAQTMTDWEVLFVDDGSSDGSGEICDRLRDAEPRFRVIHQKNAGAGPARNAGIDASRGEWLCFLDADDKIEPDMLERLYQTALRDQCDAVVCGYDTFIEDHFDDPRTPYVPEAKVLTGQQVRDEFCSWFPEGYMGYLWNKLYRASLIRENGLRFPDMRRLQDGAFNIDFFGKAASLSVIPDILYHYQLNPQTSLFRKIPKNYNELLRQLSDRFLKARKSWGSYPDDRIAHFYLNEFAICLENICSPNWDLSREEQKNFFERLRSDDLFRDLSRRYQADGRYKQLLLKGLSSGAFAFTLALIRIKVFLKKNCEPLFYFLKRKGNAA